MEGAFGVVRTLSAVRALALVDVHGSASLPNQAPGWARVIVEGNCGLILKRCLRSVRDSKVSVRVRAIQSLGDLGQSTKAATEALCISLRDPEQQIRVYAAQALGHIGNKAAISALANSWKQDKSGEVRVYCSFALKNLGFEAKENLSELIQLLKENDDTTQHYAMSGLEEMGGKAKPAVPTLIKLLESRSVMTKRAAAITLGSIGPEAKAAVPALMKGIASTDEVIRRSCLRALERIQKK